MKLPRRAFLQLAAVAAMPHFAWAQAYPIRSVRAIVGLAAGGAADILARLMHNGSRNGLVSPSSSRIEWVLAAISPPTLWCMRPLMATLFSW